jgi:lysozyme family protein
MDFLACVKVVLGHEGHLSVDSNDPGGTTKYGISQRAYPDILIEDLSESDAIEIYERDYWAKIQAQHLPKRLRLLVFDCAVNQGVTRASMMLQRACGVAADGNIGQRTLAALKDFDIEFLIDSIARQRMQSYIRNPKWNIYGAGWAVRLLDVVLRCQTSCP